MQNGKIPFDMWFLKLDKSKKAKVLVWLDRCKLGQYGKFRNLKKGISELKFDSGERIYFAELGNVIILLLQGGNKTRQSNDIKVAQEYLQDYLERNKNG